MQGTTPDSTTHELNDLLKPFVFEYLENKSTTYLDEIEHLLRATEHATNTCLFMVGRDLLDLLLTSESLIFNVSLNRQRCNVNDLKKISQLSGQR